MEMTPRCVPPFQGCSFVYGRLGHGEGQERQGCRKPGRLERGDDNTIIF